MRFGLSDLDELPSLKEFEALAREALGTDEGVAPSGTSDESVLDVLPTHGAEGASLAANGDTPQADIPGQVAERVTADESPSRAVSVTNESESSSEEHSHKTAAAGE